MYKTASSSSGNYSLTLPPGSYTVFVPEVGFTLSRFERPNVLVQSAQSLRLDIRLDWGSNLGTPGDDQSTFNLPKIGSRPGPAPRTRDGKPDFTGVWIAAADPHPEEPAFLAWRRLIVKERIANAGRDNPSTLCLPPFVFPGALSFTRSFRRRRCL